MSDSIRWNFQFRSSACMEWCTLNIIMLRGGEKCFRKAKVIELTTTDCDSLYVIEIRKRNKAFVTAFKRLYTLCSVNRMGMYEIIWNVWLFAIVLASACIDVGERVSIQQLNVLGTRTELIMTWIISYSLFPLEKRKLLVCLWKQNNQPVKQW